MSITQQFEYSCPVLTDDFGRVYKKRRTYHNILTQSTLRQQEQN